MRLDKDETGLDDTDRRILSILQNDCKTPLARIGTLVGLSAPSIVERIRKLEEAGTILGYHALLDSRRVGLDVTAFIGVSGNYPVLIEPFERVVDQLPAVLECHHVTGEHTLLLKVKTRNTRTLEEVISRLRNVPGVERTNTMVVLSTRTERQQLPLTTAATSSDDDAARQRGAKRLRKPDEPATRDPREGAR